jgi:aminopeptidase N
MDAITPEYFASEDILNDAFQYSMPIDVSTNTHPLQNDALTPYEIDSYFSGITYEKGGSINRMMEGFLTKATFQKGLRYYLKDM